LKILPFSADHYYVQLIIVKAQGSVQGGKPRRLDEWRNVEQLCHELILYTPSQDNSSISKPVTDLARLWQKEEYNDSTQEFAFLDIIQRFDAFQTWLSSVRWKCDDDILGPICKAICLAITQLREDIEVLKIEADIWDENKTTDKDIAVLRLRCSRMRDLNGRSIATSAENGILTSFEVYTNLSREEPCIHDSYYWSKSNESATADPERSWTKGRLEVEGEYTLVSRMFHAIQVSPTAVPDASST
jgi:hypothetical protein